MTHRRERPVWQWLSWPHQFLTSFLELLSLSLRHDRRHLAKRRSCLFGLRPTLPRLSHGVYQRHRIQVFPSLPPESGLLGLRPEVLRVSLLERLGGLLGSGLRVRVVLLPRLLDAVIALPGLGFVRHLLHLLPVGGITVIAAGVLEAVNYGTDGWRPGSGSASRRGCKLFWWRSRDTRFAFPSLGRALDIS